MNMEDIQKKLEDLISQHNNKLSEAQENAEEIHKLQASQNKFEEEIIFLRGQIKALNEVVSKEK